MKNSHLYLNESYPPALSILTFPKDSSPNLGNHDHDRVQMGLPVLADAGSSTHVSILRHWLEDCDFNHTKCKYSGKGSLPTRLIFVPEYEDDFVKLHETKAGESLQYLALSHPWGPPPHFCTDRENIHQHLSGIEMDKLPATFRHAVQITRSLGFKYLWIDSLCIIQGDDGDFQHEAQRMGDVFSNASCVLAACSALGQSDGFLKPREKTNVLVVENKHRGPPVYIRKFIDNFDQDVLKGRLNQRGWVLQERALARRTIFFTNTQTYWECGHGVRCETLTKMNNELASFLGDPAFPKVALESSHGQKILLHQDLCVKYSNLGFTRHQDRPVGIAGLEQRLLGTLGVRGGFGVVDDPIKTGFFRRSLLWHRAHHCTALQEIPFTDQSTAPPSWSWMACWGGIEYLEMPFGKTDWETHRQDINSPWTEKLTGTWTKIDDMTSTLGLAVIVRELVKPVSNWADLGRIILDDPTSKGDSAWDGLCCVVLGNYKSNVLQAPDANTHAVLLVSRNENRVISGDKPLYRRVGVGLVPGDKIRLDRAVCEGVLI